MTITMKPHAVVLCRALVAVGCALAGCTTPDSEPSVSEQLSSAGQPVQPTKTSCVAGREAELSRQETTRLRARAQPEHPLCASLRDPTRAATIPTLAKGVELGPRDYDFILCDASVTFESRSDGAAVKHSSTVQVAVAKAAPGQPWFRLPVTCSLACTGSSCSLSGCDAFGSSECTSFNCSGSSDSPCTGTCTKTTSGA